MTHNQPDGEGAFLRTVQEVRERPLWAQFPSDSPKNP